MQRHRYLHSHVHAHLPPTTHTGGIKEEGFVSAHRFSPWLPGPILELLMTQQIMADASGKGLSVDGSQEPGGGVPLKANDSLSHTD